MIGSTMSRRKTKLSALAVFAAVVLGGCGGLNPGTAAIVGSRTISHDQVDGLAQAFCTATIRAAESSGQAAPPEPIKKRRQEALGILLESELNQAFGRERGVTPNQQQVSQAVAQNQEVIEVLPEEQGAQYREALIDYTEGLTMLSQIGQQSLEEQGSTEVSPDQASAEGMRLRAEFTESLDIEVDPRYGSYEDGTVKPTGNSLSVAASDRARAAAQGQASVSGLPSSQTCG